MDSPTSVVAYLALFTAVGFLFLFVNLLVGKFLRPKLPNTEKLEVYECGEPTIGSSFVQFDLRFYVVALLFIIFDVEVAFFFPWATVYGKATHLMDPNLAKVERAAGPGEMKLTPAAIGLYRELGIKQPTPPAALPPTAVAGKQAASPVSRGNAAVEASARRLALFSLIDIGVFFAVLLVGFAYVWKRGDLDWVRAVSREHAPDAPRGPPQAREPMLVG